MALTEADLLNQVRRRLGQPPSTVLLTALACGASDTTVTLATGHGARLSGESGIAVEWDDGTYEADTIDSVNGDVATFGIRGLFGETPVDHSTVGSRLIQEPRFFANALLDEIRAIVNTELWPHVWVPKETPLTYQSTNEYFLPVATDIAKVSYAYQVVFGEIRRLDVDYTPPRLADDTNFPNGFVTIPWGTALDPSTIYLAYRAVPTTTTLLDRQGPLVALGVVATKLMESEAALLAPDRSGAARQVQEGSRLRAGMLLFERFKERRTAERLRLENEEAQGIHLVGAVGG